MAKPKPNPKPPEPAVDGGRRRAKGPLGPSVPEVSVFAAFHEGKMAATPSDMAFRGRKTGLLVTDDPSCVDRFSHAEIALVGDRDPRRVLLEAGMSIMRKPIEERIILVAGSAPLVDAALDDAWRVIAQVPADAEPPYCIGEWRTSRPKDSSTTTYQRD